MTNEFFLQFQFSNKFSEYVNDYRMICQGKFLDVILFRRKFQYTTFLFPSMRQKKKQKFLGQFSDD